MKILLASLLLALGYRDVAQTTAPAESSPKPTISAEPAAHLPLVGLRVGAVSGRLLPDDNPYSLRAQLGWQALIHVSSNTNRRGGFQNDFGVNCLRFTDAAGTAGGASYRWTTVQLAMLGSLRVAPRGQLLGGAGLNIGISCWRWPLHPTPSRYGFTGEQASDSESYPGMFYWTVGIRGELTHRWYVEGRWSRTFTRGGAYLYKSQLEGQTAWQSVSVGYWLHARPAPATP